MSVTRIPGGYVSEGLEGEQRAIVEMLTSAYWMEIETVMNYLAASISQPGAHALAVRTALREGIEEEVGHARALGRRIQELHGVVPGVSASPDEDGPQPFSRRADLASMVEAMVAAETSAIRHYMRIMRATRQVDQVTNDLVLEILRDEQRHLRRFEDFLREFSAQAA
ncbi:MAG TPA: ferritin-like domain-containing protein [Solirubrobacteraceae bacterium]|jgi:bacterioferritin|nr:ferritin-like domain-containing protein [Solirubrobacteraceae bacterium]